MCSFVKRTISTIPSLHSTSVSGIYIFSLCHFALTQPLRSYHNSDEWAESRPCGQACSNLWRTTFGGRGVAVTRWGGYGENFDTGAPGCEVSVPDGFENYRAAWRLGVRCANIRCPRKNRGGSVLSME